MFKTKAGMYLYSAVIILLVSLLTLITVYALTSSSIGQTVQETKTEISVFTSVGDYTQKYTLLNEAADEYMNMNPDISVSCSTLSDEDFNIRLQTDFASGYPSDIIITYPTYTIETLFKNGLIADLTAEFESDVKWHSAFDKSVLQFCTSDDKIFAAPLETEYIVLYANKKILEHNGLSVPETYADLKHCISVLHDMGITPFAFGLKDENLFLYQALSAGLGGSAAIEAAVNTQKFNFAYIDALSYLKELYALGAFSRDFDSANRMEAQQLFKDGNAAFIVESSAFGGDIENYMQISEVSNTFTVTAFPSPGSYYSSLASSDRNSYPVIYGAGDMTIFISTDAYVNKHDEVMDYVKYLTSTKATSKFVSGAKYISALKIDSTIQKNGPLITQCNVLALNTAEFTLSPANVTDRFIWGHAVSGGLEEMLNGTKDPQDITDEAARLAGLCSKEGE